MTQMVEVQRGISHDRKRFQIAFKLQSGNSDIKPYSIPTFSH